MEWNGYQETHDYLRGGEGLDGMSLRWVGTLSDLRGRTEMGRRLALLIDADVKIKQRQYIEC